MNWATKLLIGLLLLSLAAFVGYREFGERIGLGSTAPRSKSSDEHTHGKEIKEPPNEKEQGHEHAADGDAEGLVKLTAQQIAAAGIEMTPAASATLVKEITVPGRVGLNLDRQAKVVPKLPGTVATVNKRLGEAVAKDEVLATIESRDMADAKSQYLEAWRADELARAIFEREERLWKQKVTAEQDYLNAKNALDSAKIKLELAHQKLHTFGLSEDAIKDVVKGSAEQAFRLYEIRAPISGRVTARDLVLGQTVSTDKEVFTIADLSTVWVEMAVQPADLSFAKEGQEVVIQSGSRTARGKVIAVSPVIDPETRSAKAIAEIDNANGEWKLGDFVNAQLISGRHEANLVVPREALQTIKGQKVVFVQERGGFKMRPVTTGREDSANVEILSGLEFGETIATKNTFALKAELGKAEAEHEH